VLVGALELGGTKTIMAVGHDPLKPLVQTRITTRVGPETLEAVEGFFRDAARAHGAIGAIGIAAFGPLDLDPASDRWGRVLGTVKPGWTGVDIAPRLSRALGCPAAIDTDVNAAALAEYRLGAGQGCDPLVYLTVGTGIGGGLVVGGAPVRGLMHPEMGHIAIRRHADDDYPGICTYHGDCAEGLASGPSIVARFGCTRCLPITPSTRSWPIISVSCARPLCSSSARGGSSWAGVSSEAAARMAAWRRRCADGSAGTSRRQGSAHPTT